MYRYSKSFPIVLVCLFFVGILGCKPRVVNNTTGIKEELPSSFKDFYAKFHNDSIFQMEHIVFPLEGMPSYADSANFDRQDFHWDKKDWVLHRIIEDENFEKSYSMPSENIINEFMHLHDKSYGIQRRFGKINGEWHLIYYVGLNKLK